MEVQAIFKDIFFFILYGGVIMLSAVAALYLLLRRGNAIAPEVTSPLRLRRWTAAFLLVCAVSHVFWVFYIFHPSPTCYVMVCGFDMMLIPTIAGIMLSMLQDRHRPVWPVWMMLVPAVVLSVLSIIRGDKVFFLPTAIYCVTLYALLLLYMFFAVREYGRWLKGNYADLENKEVWQSFLVLAGFLLFFVIYSITTEGTPILMYLLQIDSIIIVALLLWRVETLQQLSDNTPSALASPAIPASIGPLLKKHCEDGQLYLQHDLTLSQLAQIIGTNRYYLSQHFAQQGLTYNAYINGLRIRHFIRLYNEAVEGQRFFTAQQLAFESGFHSYSTFSAAFKQRMGMTVTAWMHDTAE